MTLSPEGPIVIDVTGFHEASLWSLEVDPCPAVLWLGLTGSDIGPSWAEVVLSVSVFWLVATAAFGGLNVLSLSVDGVSSDRSCEVDWYLIRIRLARMGVSASGVVGSSCGRCVMMYRTDYGSSFDYGVYVALVCHAPDGKHAIVVGALVGTDTVSVSVVKTVGNDAVWVT